MPSARNRLISAALLAAVFTLAPIRAHAASKEIIELQTQVQQLLDMVQRLQSTIDARFGVIQHLVEQTSDNANKMSAAVDTLQQKLAAQNEAISGKIDAGSGQIQSVSDSVEELKSRLDKLQKSVGDLQGQMQNVQSQPMQQGGSPAGNGSSAPPQGPGGSGSSGPGSGGPPTGSGASSQAPPLQDTFQAGVRDFNGARYSVAQGEFQDVVQYYPQDDMAGTAQFYLGEIAYRTQDYPNALKAYNMVLESYSTSSKAPAAQLHKGMALIQLNKKAAGIQELRSLIQRHPQSPEAAQARSKLNAMGVHAAH